MWLEALMLVLVHQGEAPPSLARTIEAIAQGEEVAAACKRIAAAGKPGLWALHAKAKESHGVERGRLFEAIGNFGGPDAEWALISELRGTDAEGKAGAVRGLLASGSSQVTGTLLRHAGAGEPAVRVAVLEGLLKRKISPNQVAALTESENPAVRAMGFAVLARTGSPEEVARAIRPALEDASPLVQRQGVALVVRGQDRTQLFTLGQLARSQDEALAMDALGALASIEGWNVPAEIGNVLAFSETLPAVRKEAAVALRKLGGLTVLVRSLSRLRDPRAREALIPVAALDLPPEALDAVIDLLEDQECEAISRGILRLAGEPAAERAKLRMERALPELEQAIRRYLQVPGDPPATTRELAGK